LSRNLLRLSVRKYEAMEIINDPAQAGESAEMQAD
jgi:hypothetical protein